MAASRQQDRIRPARHTKHAYSANLSRCGRASLNTTSLSKSGTALTPDNRAGGGLKARLISAAVGIPIVLLATWGGVPGISAIAIAAAIAAGFELTNLSKSSDLRLFTGIITIAAAIGAAAAADADETAIALVIIGAVLVPYRLYRSSGELRNNPGNFLVFAFAALLYGAALAHAAPLVDEGSGRSWLLLAILGTFAIDTGAYFTGRAIGRHALAPKISPKKTWEGVAGGAAAAIGALIALGALLDLPLAVWQAALLGIALTVSGVAGDLFESWLKRRANVKDSGRIIPGHGGILDRIDSLAPNLVVVYWAVQLLEM